MCRVILTVDTTLAGLLGAFGCAPLHTARTVVQLTLDFLDSKCKVYRCNDVMMMMMMTMMMIVMMTMMITTAIITMMIMVTTMMVMIIIVVII